MGALLQRVFDTKLLKKKTGLPPTIKAQITSWQGALPDEKMNALLRELSAEQIVDLLAHTKSTQFRTAEIGDMPGAYTAARRSTAMAAKLTADEAAPKPVSPSVSALTARGVRAEDATPFAARETPAALTTWLAATPSDIVVAETVRAANRWGKTIAETQTLLSPAHNPHGYEDIKLLELLFTFGYERVSEALRETAVDFSMPYLRGWLTHQVTTASPVPYRQLVRLQAGLEAGTAALTVFQADVVYAGSRTPPSRTGFLRYAFTNETIEIHTHWNENDQRIVSMHVQDNSENGTEIGKWKAFSAVMEAVVVAHNAATGEMVATTRPPGRPLDLRR